MYNKEKESRRMSFRKINIKAFKGPPAPGALIAAIRAEPPDMKAIESLLESGAHIDEKAGSGQSALIVAISLKEQEIASLLIDKGADFEKKDMKGWTALMWAAATDCEKVVRLLLDKRAALCEKANDGNTALDLANGFNRGKIIEILHGVEEQQKQAKVKRKAQLMQSAAVLQHDLRRPKLRLKVRQPVPKSTP